MEETITLSKAEYNNYNALSRQIIGEFYRIDMLVDDKIIVELKAVENLLPIHEIQLVTYLKLTRKAIGLLINFNVPVLKDGIKRKINAHTEYAGIIPIRE